MGFSLVNHPFGGTPIYGNLHFRVRHFHPNPSVAPGVLGGLDLSDESQAIGLRSPKSAPMKHGDLHQDPNGALVLTSK